MIRHLYQYKSARVHRTKSYLMKSHAYHPSELSGLHERPLLIP